MRGRMLINVLFTNEKAASFDAAFSLVSFGKLIILRYPCILCILWV